jgi:hypothetical protein
LRVAQRRVDVEASERRRRMAGQEREIEVIADVELPTTITIATKKRR